MLCLGSGKETVWLGFGNLMVGPETPADGPTSCDLAECPHRLKLLMKIWRDIGPSLKAKPTRLIIHKLTLASNPPTC